MKPTLLLRPLREAKFVVKLASDEAHQNRFRRTNRRRPGRAGLGIGVQRAVRRMVSKGSEGEDGPIEPKYPLNEPPSAAYIQRTEWNVRDSDATVLFSVKPVLTGGSKRTVEFARKHGKPCMHLCAGDKTVADALRVFVDKHGVKALNVAGPRASKEPGVGDFVMRTFQLAFGKIARV